MQTKISHFGTTAKLRPGLSVCLFVMGGKGNVIKVSFRFYKFSCFLKTALLSLLWGWGQWCVLFNSLPSIIIISLFHGMNSLKQKLKMTVILTLITQNPDCMEKLCRIQLELPVLTDQVKQSVYMQENQAYSSYCHFWVLGLFSHLCETSSPSCCWT